MATFMYYQITKKSSPLRLDNYILTVYINSRGDSSVPCVKKLPIFTDREFKELTRGL